MRVYIIHYKEEFQDEPEIYPPCPHDDFIPELQKIYNTNTNDPEIECELFDNPQHHISEITTDFLLAQPTGRKIYLSNPANTSSYIYFVTYEVLDDSGTPFNLDGGSNREPTQLYHLGWRFRDLSWYTSEQEEIIESDPLKILLQVKHEITGKCKCDDDIEDWTESDCKCDNYLISSFGYPYSLNELHANKFIKLSGGTGCSISIAKFLILAHDAN